MRLIRRGPPGGQHCRPSRATNSSQPPGPQIAAPPLRLIRRRPPGARNCSPSLGSAWGPTGLPKGPRTGCMRAIAGPGRPYSAVYGPRGAVHGPGAEDGPRVAVYGPRAAACGRGRPSAACDEFVARQGLQFWTPGGLRRISRTGGVAMLGGLRARATGRGPWAPGPRAPAP